MGGVERGQAPRRQDPRPRRARHLDQLRRAPRARRRAHLPLRRHRRARAGDRRQRLRVRHLRRLRQARPRHLVQKAEGDGRRRGDRVAASVGPPLSADGGGLPPGPLERQHLKSANFRAVAGDAGEKVSRTHWHIAIANGLGWGFDGMDGVIFALVSPLIIKQFSLTIPTYRSGLQVALLATIAGLYFWPWLADRFGRRTLLAVNIALFSLLMPVVALAPTFLIFVLGRSVVGFALSGEWSLGSMLVAETWPARLRGRVISINRATWWFGASLA